MAADTEKPDESQSNNATEISLDNLDEILQQEDPGFVDSLSDIAEGKDEISDVEIETFNVEVGADSDDFDSETKVQRMLNKYPKLQIPIKLVERVKKFFRQRILIWKGKIRLWLFNSIDNIKTWPDRIKKIISDFKVFLKNKNQKFKEGFSKRTKLEKSLVMIFLFGLGGLSGLVILNIKDNKWLPMMQRPIIHSLVEVSDNEWSYDFKNETVPFLTAFPQQKHSYLFPKVIVNLKTRPGGRQFTMGAFEFFVELDSKDTAIEMKSREVEFHDLIQRVVEQFSYRSLQSERGKERLKEEIKKSLNQKVVQGWVKGVYIKFFITKP